MISNSLYLWYIDGMTICVSWFQDLIQTWWILLFLFMLGWKFKMSPICSNFISQRAVKAWIIANCIDFIILVFKLDLFYHIDGFQCEKSQKPYDAFFLGHLV